MKSAMNRQPGFSLVEVLVVIAVIGIMAGVTIPVITGAPEAAKKEKLEQDVVVVNNAIDAYLASGGDPAGLTPSGVLTALHSRVTGGMAAEMMGPQGPFLAPTVTTNPTDFSWSAVFTTEPRPRFAVVQRTEGVIFGTGPASDIGGVVERAEEERTSWLWSYAEATPPPFDSPTSVPTTASDSARTFGAALTPLSRPSFSGGTFPLSAFAAGAVILNLSNPNPPDSSRIFYSLEAAGGSFSPYDSSVTLSAPANIAAVAVSLDPSRYSNSGMVTNRFIGQPVVTWSATNTQVTYSQVMSNAVPGFAATANGQQGPFEIRYTTAGITSNALALPDPQQWGGANLTVTVQAFITNGSPLFVESEPTNTTLTAAPQSLGTPSMSPPGQLVFGSLAVSFRPASADPEDVRFFYTTNNGVNLSPETGIEGNFIIISGLGANERVTNRLIAAAPSGLEAWFLPSSEAVEVYVAPNFNFNDAGLLLFGGTIANNAEVRGSIILASADGSVPPSITFGNNSELDGDIYAPGTPNVFEGRNRLSTNRIIDLDGPVEPSGYTITVDKSGWTNNVYRRITPVTMPAVSLPTGLTNQGTATSGTLQPGYYSAVNVPNNGKITLGVAGQTTVYQFDNFDLGNGAVVEVLGPVVLTLNPGAGQVVDIGNNTAIVIGNVDHPEWLQLRMYTGNFELGQKATLYSTILNPNGSVTFLNESRFTGGVTARNLFVVNGAIVDFSEPPPNL